jgi:hypothetical protein
MVFLFVFAPEARIAEKLAPGGAVMTLSSI